MKVSPEVGGGGVPEQAECRQNKAQLIGSLQAELAELRLDILRRRKDNLLEAPQPSSSRRTTEGGRTRASFVEYVSEVCSTCILQKRLLLEGDTGLAESFCGSLLKKRVLIKVLRCGRTAAAGTQQS